MSRKCPLRSPRRLQFYCLLKIAFTQDFSCQTIRLLRPATPIKLRYEFVVRKAKRCAAKPSFLVPIVLLESGEVSEMIDESFTKSVTNQYQHFAFHLSRCRLCRYPYQVGRSISCHILRRILYLHPFIRSCRGSGPLLKANVAGGLNILAIAESRTSTNAS
jgi:hypothetical protein